MFLKYGHIAHRKSQEMGPLVSFSARWQIYQCLAREVPEMSKSSWILGAAKVLGGFLRSCRALQLRV